ncbi:MAG: hypothetical protein WCW25_04780 [Patescibacteria group bacterium]|jgi:hypothetical protein
MKERDGLMQDKMRKLEFENRVINELTEAIKGGKISGLTRLASEEVMLIQRSVTEAVKELGENLDIKLIKQRAEEIFFEKLECSREEDLKGCFQTEDEKKLAEKIYRRLIHALEKSVLKVTTRDIFTLGNIVRDVVKEAGEIKYGFNRSQWESECEARFQKALMDEIGMDGGRSSYITDGDKRYHEKKEALFQLVNEWREKQNMF